MNKITFTILFAFLSLNGYSQFPETLLSSVETNNPMIKASRKWLESELIRSKTGIYPNNPDVIYNYLWGSPDAIGNQQELEFTQTIQFPGYYFSKSSMQKQQYEQSVIMADKVKAEVLYKARNEIVSLIWLSKLEAVLNRKFKESGELVGMMQLGFEKKEFSKPAFDKVRIYHLNNLTELEKVKTEILLHQESLIQLNGGLPIDYSFNDFPSLPILLPLDSLSLRLMHNNPDIRIAQVNIEVNNEKVKLEKMNRLPRIEAGYKGETILNQKLQGIHTGISIPLWENKNKVKQAKVEETWSQLNYDQVVSEVQSSLKSTYSNVLSVFNNYIAIKEIASDSSLSESTMQLLNTGQISFPEYLAEVQLIFENQLNYLEIEKEYFLLHNKINLLIQK